MGFMAGSLPARVVQRRTAATVVPPASTRASAPSLAMHLARCIALLGLAVSTVAGCAGAPAPPTALPTPNAPSERASAIVLGDIDAKSPAKKIAELQPLADHLALHLRPFGIRYGRVIVAPDEATMTRFLREGDVDLYLGATAPVLSVCYQAGCAVTLRQWKGGQAAMAGVFVARRADGVARLDDLTGRVIAVQKNHSSVGHVLPLATLAQRGLTARQVSVPGTVIGPEEIGYFVAPGGRTAMDLLLRGQVAAVALGERTLDQFAPAVRDQMAVVDRTVAIPSHLVAVRSGFDRNLTDSISAQLIELDQAPEGRAILTAIRETERFDRLPPDAAALLDQVRTALELAPPGSQLGDE